jgi:hypothetical protein
MMGASPAATAAAVQAPPDTTAAKPTLGRISVRSLATQNRLQCVHIWVFAAPVQKDSWAVAPAGCLFRVPVCIRVLALVPRPADRVRRGRGAALHPWPEGAAAVPARTRCQVGAFGAAAAASGTGHTLGLSSQIAAMNLLQAETRHTAG